MLWSCALWYTSIENIVANYRYVKRANQLISFPKKEIGDNIYIYYVIKLDHLNLLIQSSMYATNQGRSFDISTLKQKVKMTMARKQKLLSR